MNRAAHGVEEAEEETGTTRAGKEDEEKEERQEVEEELAGVVKCDGGESSVRKRGDEGEEWREVKR